MFGNDDQVIEVAGGGGDLFADMTYYGSWTKDNYVYDDSGDKIIYSCANLSISSDVVICGSLWLFNNGETPLPSNTIRYYLSNPAFTKMDYDGDRIGYLLSIRPITSQFDPADITDVDYLDSIATSVPNVTARLFSQVDYSTGLNDCSLSEANYFRESVYEGEVFGVVIELRSSLSGGVINSVDSEMQANNKILKVITG